jgi:hypothetical protein
MQVRRCGLQRLLYGLMCFRLRPLYLKLGARADEIKGDLHPQAVGNITWVRRFLARCH